MKKLFLILFVLCLANVKAQRYLSAVFPSVDSTINISYGNATNYQNQNEILKLDLYEPQGDAFLKRPVIIFVHGGGFQVGQGDKTLPHIRRFCRNFAKKGYVCVSIDYRLDTATSGVGLYTASMRAMHDARAAVRFLRKYAATYKVDTNNMFIGGESAGGITSMLVSYVDDLNEIYPGTVMPYTVEGSSGNAGFSSQVKACLGLCAFIWDTTYIDTPSDPKIMLMHGTADPLIDWHQSLNIYTRAHNVGVPATFKLFNGATHCPWFYGLTNHQQYFDTLEVFTALFLYQYNTATGINDELKQENKDVSMSYMSDNTVLLKLGDPASQIEYIEVYSVSGRLMVTKQVQANHTVLAAQLPPGLYLLRILTDRGTYLRKVFLPGN